MQLSFGQRIGATLLACVFINLTGCATQKTELPPQTTQALGDLRDQLVQGKAQIQTTCNAARDLTLRPQADLQVQVTKLTQSIASLDSLATDNRQQFASSEERAQAYFANWNKQLETMSPSVAEAGQERREKSMKSFEELKRRIELLKGDFRPFMGQLNEVSKYLKTDTTAEGVKTITPQIKSALNKENGILSKADDVIEWIDSMRGGK